MTFHKTTRWTQRLRVSYSTRRKASTTNNRAGGALGHLVLCDCLVAGLRNAVVAHRPAHGAAWGEGKHDVIYPALVIYVYTCLYLCIYACTSIVWHMHIDHTQRHTHTLTCTMRAYQESTVINFHPSTVINFHPSIDLSSPLPTPLSSGFFGKGHMGSALMGSLQLSWCFWTEGLFGYSR